MAEIMEAVCGQHEGNGVYTPVCLLKRFTCPSRFILSGAGRRGQPLLETYYLLVFYLWVSINELIVGILRKLRVVVYYPVVTQDRLESQGSDPSLSSFHCLL